MTTYDTIRAAVTRQRDQTELPWPRDYYDAYLELRDTGFTGTQAQALAAGGYRIIGWAVIQ